MADPLPADLEYHLRPAEPVLWWGRPRSSRIIWYATLFRRTRLALASTFVQLIIIVTAVVVIVVPQGWHPVVALIFRLAFSASGVALIVTLLTIVVRQRRQRCYAITRDRALVIGGFWAEGTRTYPLEQLVELSVTAGRGGEGTIWFGAVHPDVITTPSLGSFAGAGDYVRPQFEHIADADKTLERLREAHAAAKARGARRRVAEREGTD